jgi:hypothetical protein
MSLRGVHDEAIYRQWMMFNSNGNQKTIKPRITRIYVINLLVQICANFPDGSQVSGCLVSMELINWIKSKYTLR